MRQPCQNQACCSFHTTLAIERESVLSVRGKQIGLKSRKYLEMDSCCRPSYACLSVCLCVCVSASQSFLYVSVFVLFLCTLCLATCMSLNLALLFCLFFPALCRGIWQGDCLYSVEHLCACVGVCVCILRVNAAAPSEQVMDVGTRSRQKKKKTLAISFG